jgi:hypothetical protein
VGLWAFKKARRWRTANGTRSFASFHGKNVICAFGALAVLVRSVGLDGLRTLHTGMLTYREGVPKIPAAAISVPS